MSDEYGMRKRFSTKRTSLPRTDPDAVRFKASYATRKASFRLSSDLCLRSLMLRLCSCRITANTREDMTQTLMSKYTTKKSVSPRCASKASTKTSGELLVVKRMNMVTKASPSVRKCASPSGVWWNRRTPSKEKNKVLKNKRQIGASVLPMETMRPTNRERMG